MTTRHVVVIVMTHPAATTDCKQLRRRVAHDNINRWTERGIYLATTVIISLADERHYNDIIHIIYALVE